MNPKREISKESNPFKDLDIDDWSILDQIEGRHLCSVCRKSRKYFCYNCYVPVKVLEGRIPKIKLPVKIDIIKHAREIDGKSTAAHAAVLAPDDVRIFTYPCIPDYGRNEKIVLVFPGKNAVSLENLFHSFSRSEEPCIKKRNLGSTLPVTRAVFIDSTWNQTRSIYKDQRLQGSAYILGNTGSPRITAVYLQAEGGRITPETYVQFLLLPCVVLKNRISQFWRHQNGSPRWYLATIEAIHQFLIEFHMSSITSGFKCSADVAVSCKTHKECLSTFKTNKNERNDMCKSVNEHQNGSYNGEFDNLLFFFCYMYTKIHQIYRHEDLQAYKRPLE